MTASTEAGGNAPPGFTIRGLHHYAYRCQDPVKTRDFYERVLGLPLERAVRAAALPTTAGEPAHYFHLFFRMQDGSYIAFFDMGDDVRTEPSPNTPPWVNHIALEVADKDELLRAKGALEADGVKVVGPLHHDFIESIYFVDPNGIRIEVTCRIPEAQQAGTARSPGEEFELWVRERARAREFTRAQARVRRKP